MRNWKETPLPKRMEKLEKDPRGFPIPSIVLIDKNNKPHFQINDEIKYQDHVLNKKCPICGDPLLDDMWLIGGPMSAFHPHGAYIDSPTHQECGEYALKVCPYLAVSKYNKRLDGKTLDKNGFDGMIFLDPTMIEARPPIFIMVKIRNFSLANGYIVPNRDYLKINGWKHGQIVPHSEVLEIVTEEFKSKNIPLTYLK